MAEFNRGDRVRHNTLGMGEFLQYAYGDWPIDTPQGKSWVKFDEHDRGIGYIAVATRNLKPVNPGPKPEPYLQAAASNYGVRVELVKHYLNNENVWQSSVVKQWRSDTAILHELKISEIEELLEDA